MKRYVFLVPALIALLAVTAACDDKDTTIVSGSDSQATGVTVTGVGEASAPPDIANFSVGVEVRAETVADAREQAARLATAVIEAVKDAGVDEEDIQTANVSVTPEYNYPRDGSPVIVGYIVTNTVRVKVRDIDTVSAVIDGAITAGGPAARLQGISFTIEDLDAIRGEAREAAVADARAKAEQLADLAGASLGDVLAISETVSGGTSVPDRAAGGAGEDTDTPIQPGTTTVTVTVNVRYGLE